MLRADMDPEFRLLEEVEELTGAETGILYESSATLLPSTGGGVLRADGTIKIAVIRPCVSRGKKIRGLSPIYTPSMLAEDASVFCGWPMFMDHVTEEMQEALRKKGRSVNELGGRIVESWWDPAFTHPEDSKFGFQPGAVLAYALPQPGARAMIEADPEILRCSINAWPKSARPGKAPWNNQEGMLIEGISDEPPGSVDWVIRAGAGGRVLQEAEQLAVSIIERAYSAAHDRPHNQERLMDIDLATASADEIREALEAERPEILAELAPKPEAPKPAPPAPVAEGDQPLTLAALQEVLDARDEKLKGDLTAIVEEHSAEDETRVSEELARRDLARVLEKKAHQLIEGTDGLTEEWQAELKSKYRVLPSGPSRALELIEDDDDGTAEEHLRESVEADVERALELIRSTKPEPRPNGLGGGGGVEEGASDEPKVPKPGENEFIDHLVESGFAEDHAAVVKKLRGEAVTG